MRTSQYITLNKDIRDNGSIRQSNSWLILPKQFGPACCSTDRLNSRLPLPREIYDEKIQKLIDLEFVEKNDKSKLTLLGRDAFKVVLVGGVFDLIHPGHITHAESEQRRKVMFSSSLLRESPPRQ